MIFSELIQEKIDALMAMVNQKLPAKTAKMIQQFLVQFYNNVSEDDFLSWELNDLYASTISFWNYLAERKPQEKKLRVYNPSFERDGWESHHTIVELSQDDMPFLVDTLIMELNRLGLGIHLILHCGNLRAVRNDQGVIEQLLPPKNPKNTSESSEAAIYFEIDRQEGDAKTLGMIREALDSVLVDTALCVRDFLPMKDTLLVAIKNLDQFGKKIAADLKQESLDFLNWLCQNHFTFLGYAYYSLKRDSSGKLHQETSQNNLGILKEDRHRSSVCLQAGVGDLCSFLPEEHEAEPLLIYKSSDRSRVHRPAFIDGVRVFDYDSKGEVKGEHRFLGLYTSVAYHSNPVSIPFLRRKVNLVIERASLPMNGHAGKALVNILENFPRDELFQIDDETLFQTAMGILRIQERQKIKLFVRKDVYGRFFSCMVFVPRDLFHTELRVKFQNILMQELGGIESTFTPTFLESVLCRIDYTIRIDPALVPDHLDLKHIEAKLIMASRNWVDDLRTALCEIYGEHKGSVLHSKYCRAFLAAYQEAFLARSGAVDIGYMEALTPESPMSMYFYRMLEEPDDRLRFKIFHLGEPLALTRILPIIENMGLQVISERPYRIKIDATREVWLSDFGVRLTHKDIDLDQVGELFEDALKRIWVGEAENDGFNRLLTTSGLSWRQIMMLRAYTKYLMQVGSRYSQSYIETTFSEYPEIVKCIWELFELRFSLDLKEKKRETLTKALQEKLATLLDGVTNLDMDRILRRFIDVVKATLRTNFYQTDKDGHHHTYLSFKMKPDLVPGMPKPTPMFEIFVYSPSMEGVHLRGAKVARGGIRWSDRREDFRREVLGLMKAQQVKNAVIVPLGAKGGFIPKNLPVDQGREAILEEGVRCYKILIRGLLDLTDNIVAGKVVPPKHVVRYDEDDPYLVVAADKGTATFSDIANGVAKEYKFWLGDAFASGGSNGYDHKAMGITARGAWESVKRHFACLGRDIHKEPFTAIGIGDMSGDVFGNGLLLSKQIKLVAAFNHMHIFLDPHPDPAKSFKERDRLFRLPRSTWKDYDSALISEGGGVFERRAKVIELSSEVKKLLDLTVDRIEPDLLISAILKAKVDLLWNGGIGTYVKSEKETHLDVGDRANDGLRINGKDLRCLVVGEGGNLGFTQLGRVEFAQRGGHIYTDAIDNSAGVDCSDHEVNIKILLDAVMNDGQLTVEDRSTFLSEMKDQVGDLVLDNNYHQTQSIDNLLNKGKDSRHLEVRLLQELEREGYLDRALEFLPDDKELATRYAAGQRLTAPEIAVMTAYTKTAIKKRLLQTNCPEDAYFQEYIFDEFPHQCRTRYQPYILKHQLGREIIVTQLTNRIIQHCGITFVHRLYDETGAHAEMIVRAYAVMKEVIDLDHHWKAIEALDGHIKAQIQSEMMNTLTGLVRRTCRWLLRNHRGEMNIPELVSKIKPKWAELIKMLPKFLGDEDRRAYKAASKQLVQDGVPKTLADFIALCPYLAPIMDVMEAANQHPGEMEIVVKVFFTLNDTLNFAWLRRAIGQLTYDHYWRMLASAGLRDDLDQLQRTLTLSILLTTDGSLSESERIETWLNAHRFLVTRWSNLVGDLKDNKQDLVVYLVAIRGLIDLAQAATKDLKSLQLML